MMMKIGAFAKLCGMTVKTLHHYDELGLLKPAHVEEHSGYRYYTADQLLTIRRIEGFKEQGLTLEMIRPLLSGVVSLTEAGSMLLEKRKDLESQILKAQRQLEEIDERLERIDSHADEEDGRISLRSVEPALVASIRETLPKGQLCLLLDKLKQYVRLQGEDSDGQVTIVRHRMADGDEELSDIEVAIPISKMIPASRSVKVYELPGVKEALVYTHRCDPYQNSCRASETLRSWVVDEGYRALETIPVREVYLTSDKDIYGQLRMAEMIMPVERGLNPSL